MTAAPGRRTLTTALRDMLRAVTGVAVEVNEVPTAIELDSNGRLVRPYAIIYPLGGASPRGSLGLPSRDGELVYQVTSVGSRTDQVEWLADRVMEAIMAREAGGNFVNALTADGVVVTDRKVDEYGATIPGGRDVLSVPDTYRVKVSAT